MKLPGNLLILLSSVFLVTEGCGDYQENTSSQPATSAHQRAGNWPNAVTYEIFVQSFYDTDGDGIGDLNGVTTKLDYLKELGIEAIWLMPISPSPSYHKYDVVDYRDIHPDYGTLQDFKDLVTQAHNRNIKVIIDLVINHTGRDHPWFQQALTDTAGEYRDYYVWADKDSIAEQISKKEIRLDSDNITQWHEVADSDQLYYGYFWGGMPDLNYDNQQVKQEIFDIGRFWLQELDVDGFRLDAAKHIFPDDRAEDNHEWWVEFRSEMEKVKPDVFLLGEVWDEAELVAPYLKGLPALFNFDIGKGILEAVNSGKGQEVLTKHLEIQNFYRGINPQYVDAIFITNHDQNRAASEFQGNKQKTRIAAAILLTLPGSPFIYYGEELGMLGVKPDEHIREPFNWAQDGKDKGETSWLTPKYSTDRTVAPLAEQQEDSLSIFNHYKRLINLRNDQPALTYGKMIPIPSGSEGVSSFLRVYDQDSIWVVHNLSNKAQTIPVETSVKQINHPLFENGSWTSDSTNLRVDPYTSLIFQN